VLLRLAYLTVADTFALVRVGAENYVTSCDLQIFVDQAAEAVPAQDMHIGHVSRPASPCL
jgi:hypothetical protein